ncbi:MAG: hypothetical protein N3E46_12220 [Gemmataceae bacterium]|jgi:hypothetical protein|uniref:Uncharacterized protein n=1 Tax=Thermogemmata fonticola TaxID=2755323 RepID=A0A7V9AC18_9BACT|nr:hypothetical protein [Thermogemmata fonticola]MBA2226806.1 hypothetical protein [Thermogemmata fonticola]MCX8140437.1 hypothetical protein [Gemmataceae bacterium]
MALALGYAETLNRAAATLAPFYRKLKRFAKQIPARRRTAEALNLIGGESNRLGKRTTIGGECFGIESPEASRGVRDEQRLRILCAGGARRLPE